MHLQTFAAQDFLTVLVLQRTVLCMFFVTYNLGLQVLATDRGQAVRLVAGNTGAGVYKNWPTEDTLVYIMKVWCPRKQCTGSKRAYMRLTCGPPNRGSANALCSAGARVERAQSRD